PGRTRRGPRGGQGPPKVQGDREGRRSGDGTTSQDTGRRRHEREFSEETRSRARVRGGLPRQAQQGGRPTGTGPLHRPGQARRGGERAPGSRSRGPAIASGAGTTG